MNDRELLEAAAKAAGMQVRCVGNGEKSAAFTFYVEPSQLWWSPLVDDGDALRLAVKLSLTVAIRGHECEVFAEDGDCLASVPIMGASCFANAAEATNPAAATRRAIVRAAAAMGAA